MIYLDSKPHIETLTSRCREKVTNYGCNLGFADLTVPIVIHGKLLGLFIGGDKFSNSTKSCYKNDMTHLRRFMRKHIAKNVTTTSEPAFSDGCAALVLSKPAEPVQIDASGQEQSGESQVSGNSGDDGGGDGDDGGGGDSDEEPPKPPRRDGDGGSNRNEFDNTFISLARITILSLLFSQIFLTIYCCVFKNLNHKEIAALGVIITAQLTFIYRLFLSLRRSQKDYRKGRFID